MTQSLAPSPVNFHISLNVSDINRSVEFFRKVFGTEPAKHRADYAKFELQNPPVTFSLEPVPPAERGALNHVGFRLRSPEELVEFQRRLEMAGIRSEREEGVECCYAKQTKFWLHDPDGTLWEMYVLEGDLEHRGAGQEARAVKGGQYAAAPEPIVCSSQPQPVERRQWSHRLGSPLTIPAEHADESLNEIALQGTFNGDGALLEIDSFLRRTLDRLQPGGRLAIHCLTSDRHVTEELQLPGPASVVRSVPCLDSLLDHLEGAGFEAIRLTKYGSHACFTVGEAELRETMIEAFKPGTVEDECVTVVYKGPFLELKLDDGTVLQRGRRTSLPQTAIDRLRSGPGGDSLVVLETATSPVACTG